MKMGIDNFGSGLNWFAGSHSCCRHPEPGFACIRRQRSPPTVKTVMRTWEWH